MLKAWSCPKKCGIGCAASSKSALRAFIAAHNKAVHSHTRKDQKGG